MICSLVLGQVKVQQMPFFVVRQIQEQFLAKKRELCLAFVDLEKAFDRVPRDVVW